jgi:ubiquinone/menaquinone biosynthesis C-methylase UbiE
MKKEGVRFKLMLEYFLNKIGLKDLKKLSVLDVACGRCNEAEVLIELFGKVRGIDNNPKKIKRIKGKNLNARFGVIDASNLSNISDHKFNFVLVRHPNIFGDKWKKIYEECFRVTKEKGILISTFYHEEEYLLGKKLIKNASYDIKFAKENKFYLKSFGFDKYVIIAKKVYKRGWLKKLFGI